MSGPHSSLEHQLTVSFIKSIKFLLRPIKQLNKNKIKRFLMTILRLLTLLI
jgi:hypothetical protein